MRVYRLAAAAFLVVACQDDPSGIPRENLAQHVNEPVFSINPSVVDSVVSVFVKYEPGLRAEERVHAAMRAGARLAADIERRGVLVTELPRDSVARIAGLWWVRSVEVGKDDLRPTGWFGLSSLVEAMEPLAEQLPWGVARIDADDVHALGYRGTGATIGIIDDGYNCGHQDIVSHHGFGLYDFVLMEPYGWENWCTLGFHGSGVVGIAAASRDNGVAVIGVSPEATVYLLRVCSDLLGCTEARIALALDMAASRDLDVVNISLGNCGQNISGGLSDALDDAYEQGVTIVVSGGNGIYSDPPCSPGSPVSGLARHAATIGVSAINQDGLYATGYQYGPEIELAAPQNTLSIHYSDQTGTMPFSGTSAAAPHVTGVVALLVQRGYTTPAAIRQRLTSTAEDLGAAGRDDFYGFGLVDALAAVAPPPPPSLTAYISGPAFIYSKGSYTWEAMPSGGIGHYSYQWRVRYAGGNWIVLGSSKTQSKMVYMDDPDFEMKVTVVSGSLSVSPIKAVAVCAPGECEPNIAAQ